jgi:hypothetical protein
VHVCEKHVWLAILIQKLVGSRIRRMFRSERDLDGDDDAERGCDLVGQVAQRMPWRVSPTAVAGIDKLELNVAG